MSLIQRQPMLPAFPEVDLDDDGGTLISTEEYEEIDPADGCKIHVTVSTFRTEDGSEEQRTQRRKIKVNCLQTLKRYELLNGKQEAIEEKTVRLIGDLDGFHAPEILVNTKQICDGSERGLVALPNSQNSFFDHLNEHKKDFIKMFPDLFNQMRTPPSLLSIPSTTAETIVNEDGSTTTRFHSSKSFSSQFSKQETYINGVKQTSKCKFRAFMEYRGPNGGFKVKLNDNADEDLSETEYDDDDTTSRASEIPDSQSDFVLGDGHYIPQKAKAASKKNEKAWHAAKELVDSEQRYVEKLKLLDKFRAAIEKEKILDRKQLSAIFANISSLYQFHNNHLLPQLMDKCREWQTTRRISDVMKKQAPFLKMYSEYTNNYNNAYSNFIDYCKKKKKFLDIVRKFEQTPECDNMPLGSHLICPVQRVMRYQLLLQEYKKHLEQTDGDYEDTTTALNLVLEAANHANNMLRQLERYRDVLEVQEQIGNSIPLVSPSRVLLKKGAIMKTASATNRAEERMLFIFNDLILLCSERKYISFSKYKVRAIFDAFLTQICEGDNLERENSFYIRGADSANGPSRCLELFCESREEKEDWMNAIWQVISEAASNTTYISSKSNSRNSLSSKKGKACANCKNDFSLFNWGTKCHKCGERYCRKCFDCEEKTDEKACRACQNTDRSKKMNIASTGSSVLNKPARDDDDIIMSSMVVFKGSANKPATRFFVLRKDFCLYSYVSPDDKTALTMMPVPGCVVKQSPEPFSFSIKHMNRMYIVTVGNVDDQGKWMAVLDLAANAQIDSS
ncbi:hypothetical protein QR680_002722 [Steinernema hermaphroditum]|uniref:DH domain-containing protein n=1 Tax=Steinernema hermaphroditum TaxID=289476 RepID=A0AA39LI89_9BILA|nr:hypothetical protein QR680_002722 [Steinernema hermaphroditum]